MKAVMDWALTLFGITIAIWFIVYVIKVFFGTETYPKELKIALICAMATMLTILGSVKTAQYTNDANAKQQRAADVRKIKQGYYNSFLEALSVKYAQMGMTGKPLAGNDSEFRNANEKFCIEVNRLPLYASQEVVELVNKVASGQVANPEFSKFFELIREDLCTDVYEPFKNLPTIHIQFPNPPVKIGKETCQEMP